MLGSSFIGILPLVKPYGDYNSSTCMVEALIDYYLGLSYRPASSKYSFSIRESWALRAITPAKFATMLKAHSAYVITATGLLADLIFGRCFLTLRY